MNRETYIFQIVFTKMENADGVFSEIKNIFEKSTSINGFREKNTVYVILETNELSFEEFKKLTERINSLKGFKGMVWNKEK